MTQPAQYSTQIVVFLQNAWSPVYAGQVWERESWLRALVRSRSGQRLRVLIDDFDLCENTTPIVGDHPDSVVPPDATHIRAILERRKPNIVVACGRQAETALLSLWEGPMLAIPHPAHRLLTDNLYRVARQLLACDFSERIALRQKMGSIERTNLPVVRTVKLKPFN